MRTIRILVVIPRLLFFSFSVFAQKTAFFEDIGERIQLARELYRQEKYNSAYQEFDKITRQVDPKSEIYSEAQFYKSVSALKSGLMAGYKMVDRFIEDFPESPYLNRAWFNLGSYQFGRKHYAAVLRSFAEVDRSELDEFERIQLKYQYGYSHLMMDNEEQALAEFDDIKDANNIYSRPASYYWAHIMYLRENYQSALEGFSRLNGDPTYSRVIPLYVSHIYYKQQKYQEVVN
jgi:tetratricopeptide (TPR) repeat protein